MSQSCAHLFDPSGYNTSLSSSSSLDPAYSQSSSDSELWPYIKPYFRPSEDGSSLPFEDAPLYPGPSDLLSTFGPRTFKTPEEGEAWWNDPMTFIGDHSPGTDSSYAFCTPTTVVFPEDEDIFHQYSYQFNTDNEVNVTVEASSSIEAQLETVGLLDPTISPAPFPPESTLLQTPSRSTLTAAASWKRTPSPIPQTQKTSFDPSTSAGSRHSPCLSRLPTTSITPSPSLFPRESRLSDSEDESDGPFTPSEAILPHHVRPSRTLANELARFNYMPPKPQARPWIKQPIVKKKNGLKRPLPNVHNDMDRRAVLDLLPQPEVERILVQHKTPSFVPESYELPIPKQDGSNAAKRWRCSYVLDNGRCNSLHSRKLEGQRHLYTHTPLRFLCPGSQCGKLFARDDAVKRHVDGRPVGSSCKIGWKNLKGEDCPVVVAESGSVKLAKTVWVDNDIDDA
ncbi:hypothetical protein M422DRAFT_63147 [Sphaerobolus stellatus SS14]|nr:hypothetical protein M422DRAFT_63147 [Sphaerobolus stellatus SS14]